MDDRTAPKRSSQRFANYGKALLQLERFISKQPLNEMEEQGLIQSFEYTYELAWKTLQDLLRELGYQDIAGPRTVIERAFGNGILLDGDAWMRMFKDRNLTSHTYDEATAKEIIEHIRGEYLALFQGLRRTLRKD